MALTNMARSKKDRKSNEAICSPDDSKFPYGLSIDLNEESLEKLDLDDMPDIGTKLIVAAVGEVTSVNQHKSKSDTTQNLTIQLQRLEVGPLNKKEKSAESAVDDAIKEL